MIGGWPVAVFYVVIILLIIAFLAGIALMFLRSYKHASTIFLICGILTLPVGIFGIIGSMLLWQLSFLPACSVCKVILKKDRMRPGYYQCPNCGSEFGMVEINRNH
jgi:hypothetical protein